ncbi:hypothetical protein [Emticicia fontis]
MKRDKKKAVLRWNKQMIAEMLNVDLTDLKNCISDDTVKAVGWTKGQQLFNDVQVYTIIKDFRRLATDEQIKAIIYPFGMM